MIDDEKYKSLLESGLLLDHYFLLCNIKNDVKLVDTKRIQGFINLLSKRGYLQDGKLTDAGDKLVETCKKETTKKLDFAEWVLLLHKKCQDKLVELTGEKQVRPVIEKKAYTFLCNHIDLNRALSKVIVQYKLKDFDKIEKTLMNYMEKCSTANNWFPLLQYFIIKNGSSAMVTSMESLEEDEPKATSTQKFV